MGRAPPTVFALLGRAGEREQLLHALDVPEQLVEVVVHHTLRDWHLHDGGKGGGGGKVAVAVVIRL